MLKFDRQHAIEEMLKENGSILVTDVCARLNCSDQTIRRDLQELESKGQIIRVHGGAYLPTSEDKGAPIQLRVLLIPKEKEVIANIAVSNFIDENDVIMMDSSTTCLTMAKAILAKKLPVTIITNSLSIVSLFSNQEQNSSLICIGGHYNKRSSSFVGDDTISTIAQYVADKSFISCNALDYKHGLLDNNDRQKMVRATMLRNSKMHYLLVDHTKFDDVGNYIISDYATIDGGIITDQKPPKKWMDFFNSRQIKVLW